MAFPTTGLLDNFNRADALLNTGNWAAWDGLTALSILTNVVGSASGLRASYWSARTFGPNCEVFAKVATPAVGMWLICRCTNPTTPATINGYQMSWDGAVYRLHKLVAGVQTQLGANIAGTLAANDVLGISAIGTTITLYKNGVALDFRTDSSVTSAGNIAIQCENTTSRWDDFGGGTLKSLVVGDRSVTRNSLLRR